MTDEPSSGEVQRESRRRRRRLLLVLLVALTAITWIFPAASVGLSDFSPKASPTATVAASNAPSPLPSDPAPAASDSPTAGTSGLGDGDGSTRLSAANFQISGSGADSLRPGVVTVIRLTITNPNGVPIYVTGLEVVVSNDPAGCNSQTNLRIVQSNASSASPITVPARGTITLATAPRAPQVTLLNLPDVNQDACKSKAFILTYSGSAHS
jgi:hypothetical protein